MKNNLLSPLLLFTFLVSGARLSAQTIYTFAGNGSGGYSGDGSAATAAELYSPYRVATDAAGNIYIADQVNNRIRMVNTSGTISTVAGNGAYGFTGDAGPATNAELANPSGVALDASGNMYIVDEGNQRIRVVNTTGNIATFAGNGVLGYSGDAGAATAAELGNPYGVATDAAGNVYIADYFNSRIRKVNTSGTISTVAGNGVAGFSGDGGLATNAELHYPSGVAADAAGNIYIADRDNYRIRVVSASGKINTIAGNGTSGFSGDGGIATAAEINPVGVAIAGSALYIADGVNNRIRMIGTAGRITTIAGQGFGGYSGDGGAATAAEIYNPTGVAVDASGNVYIADYFNNRIRMVNTSASIHEVNILANEVSFYPNPFCQNSNLKINLKVSATVTMYNMLGQTTGTWQMEAGRHTINTTQNMPAGVYMFQVKTQKGIVSKKVIKAE